MSVLDWTKTGGNTEPAVYGTNTTVSGGSIKEILKSLGAAAERA